MYYLYATIIGEMLLFLWCRMIIKTSSLNESEDAHKFSHTLKTTTHSSRAITIYNGCILARIISYLLIENDLSTTPTKH